MVQAHLALVWYPQQHEPGWSMWTDGTDTGKGGERGNISVCKAPRGLWLVLESCNPISIFSSVTVWLWGVI